MKANKQQVLAGFLVFSILVILVLQTTSKPPLSWMESYEKSDTAPYGGKVFYDQFKKATAGRSFQELNLSTYEWLRSDPEEGVFFAFNSSFSPDKETKNRLLKWVADGNTAFVSARFIGNELLDSLGLKINSIIELDNFKEYSSLSLENKDLMRSDGFTFDRIVGLSYFSFKDSINTQILGTNKFKDSEKQALPNFISIIYGDGEFILHLFPLAFSNYFMLDADNKAYTEAVMGYFPKEGTVFYDNYNKIGKSRFSSPLYLFLSNPNLKMAYYAMLVMLVLWIVFEGRRKQRSIPILKPLENQTVAFAETISAMYMERKAFEENVQQQITLFLEYCRTNFRLGMELLDQESMEKLSARSGRSLEETKHLFDLIQTLRDKVDLSESDVVGLNQKISEFKKHENGRK